MNRQRLTGFRARGPAGVGLLFLMLLGRLSLSLPRSRQVTHPPASPLRRHSWEPDFRHDLPPPGCSEPRSTPAACRPRPRAPRQAEDARACAQAAMWSCSELPPSLDGRDRSTQGQSQTLHSGLQGLGEGHLGAGRVGTCPEGAQEGARPHTPAGKPQDTRGEVKAVHSPRRDIYTLRWGGSATWGPRAPTPTCSRQLF